MSIINKTIITIIKVNKLQRFPQLCSQTFPAQAPISDNAVNTAISHSTDFVNPAEN